MTDTKQPKNWRRMLADLGGYENGLINIPAAGVIPIIDEVEQLRAKLDELEKQEPVEIDWPDYHSQGMGCGLEDRGIRDRYEAMRHGWDQAIERVAECLPEKLYLAAGARPVGEVPAGEYPPLPEVYATMHDDGHWTMKAGKEPYESYYAGWRKTVYTADQMWRYVDADRAMRAAQPAPAAQDDAKDAARYRWLTDDHERPATRIVRNQLCERLPWMSYSAVSADIDAAIEASKREPT